MRVFDLTILKDLDSVNKFNISEVPDIGIILKEYTKFSEVENQDIEMLRVMLFNRNSSADLWCEKIFRFSELNLKKIGIKVNAKYRSNDDKIFFIDQLVTLFLEYAYYYNDLRYLNIGLKLLDQMSSREKNTYNKLLGQFLLKTI